MSTRTCTEEEKILLALGEAPLPEPLARHQETCPSCREAASLARALRGLAAADLDPLPSTLPSAEQIWWKARVIRRLIHRDQEEERAARPALFGRWLGVTVSVAGVVAFLSWRGASALEEALGSGAPGWSGLVLAAGGLLPLAALLAAGLLERES